MNEDYYEQNSCYDPNSFGFDQYQPPQFPVNYPPQETSKEILQAQEDLMEAIQAFLKEYDHIPPNEKCMALLLRKKETATQGFIPYYNFSMIDDEEARDNFLKDVCTFLRKFSRIPFGVTPKVILIAWERFGEIKDALTDKQYRQEDIQELMSKLLEDVRNISEELSKYINCPRWNRPTFYDNDNDEYTIIYSKPKAITPDISIEEPDNSLNMGKSILTLFLVLRTLSQSQILSDFNNDGTSSDDDSYENIEYVEASPLNLEYDSLEKVNEDQEEKEFDLEDIFQIQDVILHEKLSDNRFLSHLDNSLPEFETFSDHTKETRSGSTTTHANNSPSEYDSFLFEVEPDQGGLISIVISDNSDNSLLELSEFESFHFDPSFLRPPLEPPDVEISLIIKTDAPICYSEFSPVLTYPVDSPFLCSFRNEDTIYNPDIST
ncbi:hypothetical protein Tco_0173218 [Tanacetum coccineum]